jgi:hypothetical protein
MFSKTGPEIHTAVFGANFGHERTTNIKGKTIPLQA